MSNFEDNPSVNHKPIDVIKTQLHYIHRDIESIDRMIRDVHSVQNQIISILKKMEEGRIERERKIKEEKDKIQSGWGLF